MDGGSNEQGREDEIPEEAIMDNRRPGLPGTVLSATIPSMHGCPKTHVWTLVPN